MQFRYFSKLTIVAFAVIDLLLLVVTSIIILYTTFKSSWKVKKSQMNIMPSNEQSRIPPVPKTKTILDPNYTDYGGVYLGSSLQKQQNETEMIVDDIESSSNNIVKIEEMIELNASTLTYSKLSHNSSKNAVKKIKMRSKLILLVTGYHNSTGNKQGWTYNSGPEHPPKRCAKLNCFNRATSCSVFG